MSKEEFQAKMRQFYSGVHVDNDQDDEKYQQLAEKFRIIQTEMYKQQEELNEIITDMDQIVDAAHKVDDKKKRKDRHETLSQQGIKDRKGIKTRTKQATAKKVSKD
jgi:methyl-accepting chemotaxis protein